MCGITGVIERHGNPADCIETMTDSMLHRGPDGSGTYNGHGFAFGHRRLAIVDLSIAGKQPMHYQDRYVITYNGEIYNHVELRQELQAAGYSFLSDTDTEVIMAAYDCWGTAALNKFNGMWAFVLYDKEKDQFLMSRDRFGIKPFYYYQDKERFIFASEVKAILLHPDVEPKANRSYLDDYLSSGQREYAKETAFQNIYRFTNACYALLDKSAIGSELQEHTFWQLNVSDQPATFSMETARQYAQQYYELLEDSVRLRLRADVKVGSALSGGLDSSSIVYLINQQLRAQGRTELQETFSSVYKSPETKDCDESEFIDLLAVELQVNSNQIEPCEADIPAFHRDMIWSMENPPESSSMSGWHTFLKVKQEGVTVTLDGQGADEQLGGYLLYIPVYLTSLSLPDFYRELRHFWPIPGVKKQLFQAFVINHCRQVFGQKNVRRFIKWTRGYDYELNLNRRLAQDTLGPLLNLIHASDHVSMAHSIESRMPFMDYRMVEFLASVPACYKLHNGWTKYIARLAFDGKLPDEICWRRDKMGWPIPEEHWFRGNLKPWFVNQIKGSELLKQLRPELNIDAMINSPASIGFLIRFLNLSVYEELFLQVEKQ